MKIEQITDLQSKNSELIETHKKMYLNLNDPITGCLRDVHSPILKDIIEKSQSKYILEIGFNIGSSCLSWLLSSPDTYVTSIDIYNPQKSIDYISSEFSGRFAFVNMNSEMLSLDNIKNQWVNQFDLIFIDGDHSYEAVLRDLTNSLELNPKYIVFDDVRHIAHSYIEDIITQHPRLELIELYEFEACIVLTKVKYD